MKNKLLSLTVAILLCFAVAVPALATSEIYMDMYGNIHNEGEYHAVAEEVNIKGDFQKETYGNVAAVWEEVYYEPNSGQTSTSQIPGSVRRPYHLMKADSTGIHSVSGWYKSMTGFCASGYVAAQNFDGKWGAIDADGHVIVDFDYDEMTAPTDDGYVMGTISPADGKSQTYTLIDLNAGTKTTLERPTKGYNNGVMPVKIEQGENSGRWQYIKIDGTLAFPGTYVTAPVFANGYAAVWPVEGERHIIDANGNIVLSSTDDFHFDSDYCVVSREGIIQAFVSESQNSYKLGYIDWNGNRILTDVYSADRAFYNGYAVVGGQGLGGELIDTSGKIIISSMHNWNLSNVSNTGFIWASDTQSQKEEGYHGHMISAVFQVPVKDFTPPISAASAVPSSFDDVPVDAYYAEAVKWAVAHGITNGTSDTTFSPFDTATRGQVVTFLWRANGSPEPATTANPFADVSESSPFYKAILWAYENQITSGTTPTTFSPGNPCTRAHVITFSWRAMGEPVVPSERSALARSLPQGYYTNAVAWADIRGILNETDSAFSPDSLCPRADIVTYLYHALA